MTDQPTPTAAALQELPEGSAAHRIMDTLRELSRPDPSASEMELTLATVAMALEGSLGPELLRFQDAGDLDEFVLGLSRFLAAHRSDTARMLVVVELPRAARELPAGTRLHCLDEALEAQASAEAPW